MPLPINAVFHRVQDGANDYLGSANITIANAIVIRGIAVFSKALDSFDIKLAFPTYGPTRRAYIQPLDQAGYAHMLAVISAAVKGNGFSSNFGSSSTALALSVTCEPSESIPPTYFSLQIDDFCMLHGIEAIASDWPLPDGSKVAIKMPSFSPNQPYAQPGFTIFEGLISADEREDGSIQYTDYQQLINQLVREKREHLIALSMHSNRSLITTVEPELQQANHIPNEAFFSSGEIAR